MTTYRLSPNDFEWACYLLAYGLWTGHVVTEPSVAYWLQGVGTGNLAMTWRSQVRPEPVALVKHNTDNDRFYQHA